MKYCSKNIKSFKIVNWFAFILHILTNTYLLGAVENTIWNTTVNINLHFF